MVRIYVIQRARIEDNNLEIPRWFNLYCVGSKSRAIAVVNRAQCHSDEVTDDLPFHFMYRYEELVKY